MTSSPNWITDSPFRPCGRDYRTPRRPASRDALREAGRHTWGKFKRRFWGESLRRSQAGGLRPVRSPMDPVVQLCEPGLELCLVVLPRHAVHPGSRLALERVVRHPECIDCDVVQERSELLLLPLPCGLPYASQRLGHTLPALCPECADLVRVPLGPRPWLHRLRRRSPGFVRRSLSYYAGVRLLQVVHRRLRLLAFPPRTIRPEGRVADLETSRFPSKERPYMPGSPT